jgi:hypothetical protein
MVAGFCAAPVMVYQTASRQLWGTGSPLDLPMESS